LTAPEAAALRQVALYQGAVTVAGPPGYCLDQQSLRRGAAGAVVLIASCESLSGKAGTPVDPAVMTVSVLPERLSPARPSTAEIAATMAPATVRNQHEDAELALVQVSEGGD